MHENGKRTGGRNRPGLCGPRGIAIDRTALARASGVAVRAQDGGYRDIRPARRQADPERQAPPRRRLRVAGARWLRCGGEDRARHRLEPGGSARSAGQGGGMDGRGCHALCSGRVVDASRQMPPGLRHLVALGNLFSNPCSTTGRFAGRCSSAQVPGPPDHFVNSGLRQAGCALHHLAGRQASRPVTPPRSRPRSWAESGQARVNSGKSRT